MRAIEKANPLSATIERTEDKLSPQLEKEAVDGTPIKELDVSLAKVGGDASSVGTARSLFCSC